MKRYWTRIYTRHPDNTTPFPTWVTGETMEEPPRFTVCAVIDADSEDDVVARWREHFSDAPTEPCFIREEPPGWMPPTDRFPQ